MIYFIRNPKNDLVKIGTTKNLEKRLTQLRKKFGEDLFVDFSIAGFYAEEKIIHSKYADLHQFGEWFKWDDGMREMIGVKIETVNQKFFLPGIKIDLDVYLWLKNKAEKELRSLTQQLLWELENLAKQGK